MGGGGVGDGDGTYEANVGVLEEDGMVGLVRETFREGLGRFCTGELTGMMDWWD